VVLTDFNAELGEKTTADLGERAVFVRQDVTSEEDWKVSLRPPSARSDMSTLSSTMPGS